RKIQRLVPERQSESAKRQATDQELPELSAAGRLHAVVHVPIIPMLAIVDHAPNAPSIVCIAPVTKPASGPASQATIPATSSGRPWRLIAMKLCIRSFIGPPSGFASVSIGPGCTMLI